MSRLGFIVDCSEPSPQKPQSVSAALARPARMTGDDAKDPEEVARILNGVQQQIYDATLVARSSILQAPGLFTNVTCGTAGAKVTLAHHFGNFAYFFVVGWRGDGVVTAPILVDDRSDVSGAVTTKDLLSLRSYVAGVADILVVAQ